jgi:hypothetical protein
MMLEHKWAGLYKNKSLWREKGVSNYIDSIRDDVLKDMIKASLTGTVPVSLYGKSQVGKTTFTLSLLGIKEEYFIDLYNALRCGKASGNSATPTAMIYRRSENENFRLKEGTGQWSELNFQQLSQRLVDLRMKIETNTFTDLTEVIIEIPSHYFNSENDGINVQICDLPGYGSKTDSEIEHVNKILKKYVPASTIILVFVEGFQIATASELFDNGILDELYGWKYFSARYRLVITKSYSSDSVRVLLRNLDNFSKQDIVNHYREQAATDNENNVPAEVEVYPLEFGDTYNELKLDYVPEKLSCIDNIMEDLWTDLKNNINQSGRSNNYINILRNIPTVIHRIREKFNQNIDQQVISENNRIATHNGDITIQSSFCENKNAAIKEHEEIVQHLLSHGYFNHASQYQGDLIRDDMINHIQNILGNFSKQGHNINAYLSKIDSKYKINIDNKYDYMQYEVFGFISRTLKEIKKNKHFLFMGPEDWHKNSLNDSVQSYNIKVDDYNNKINAKIAAWVKEINHRITNLQQQINAAEHTISNHNNEIWHINKNIDEIMKHKTDKNEMYDKTFNETNRINEYLWCEVKTEKNEIIQNLKTKSSVDAFLDIMYCFLIIKEYKNHTVMDK